MAQQEPELSQRVLAFLRAMILPREERAYRRALRASGLFDRRFYRQAHPGLNPIYRLLPENHYIAHGERMGYRPNPGFSPHDYLRLNPDVAGVTRRALLHYLRSGRAEGRPTRDPAVRAETPEIDMPVIRRPGPPGAGQAVVLHLYYPDLWPEFEAVLRQIDLPFDLFVTLTWRGEETAALQARIVAAFPGAQVWCLPNRGRDILPFLHLVNAGVLDGYRAVAKLHGKKSPHRLDGAEWRRHLTGGILPATGLARQLAQFMNDRSAAFWVADGQRYAGQEWWGSNLARTRALLSRIEIDAAADALSFPAGSIYWLKPLMIGLLKALRVTPEMFEAEHGQVDGTLAHAVERAMGFLAASAGQRVIQTAELGRRTPFRAPVTQRPRLVSAFYLPQFHPTPENDAWWGAGYTEWRAAVAAPSCFAGHLQPMLPADLGYYDLRATEVMGAQAALAQRAGIDAFCVYHYWFDGRRILQAPLDRLLTRPEIGFPFCLCWANESWRRNWDGLSGEILLNQSYAPGFEARFAADLVRYMRDPRYLRPDGRRPRLMIYRPDDLPEPVVNVARLRAAFRSLGIGEVELGAVAFHLTAQGDWAGAFDFHVEMPPHGLVKEEDYLCGGPPGNRMPVPVAPGFRGLIYDYAAIARRAVAPAYRAALPPNTIAGIMPGWDNTARRGLQGHIAYGAHPGSFRQWLDGLLRHAISRSYRQELFINAWNEWAEKAVMEPSQTFGDHYLQVLAASLADARSAEAAETGIRQARAG
jgi:lipopolysaccharide biosynthesis protein